MTISFSTLLNQRSNGGNLLTIWKSLFLWHGTVVTFHHFCHIWFIRSHLLGKTTLKIGRLHEGQILAGRLWDDAESGGLESWVINTCIQLSIVNWSLHCPTSNLYPRHSSKSGDQSWPSCTSWWPTSPKVLSYANNQKQMVFCCPSGWALWLPLHPASVPFTHPFDGSFFPSS